MGIRPKPWHGLSGNAPGTFKGEDNFGRGGWVKKLRPARGPMAARGHGAWNPSKKGDEGFLDYFFRMANDFNLLTTTQARLAAD